MSPRTARRLVWALGIALSIFLTWRGIVWLREGRDLFAAGFFVWALMAALMTHDDDKEMKRHGG